MNLFFTPDISGSEYLLPEEESKHCVRVLRMKQGEKMILVDGVGGYYEAVIVEADPKKCLVRIMDKKAGYGKRDHYLHIACAPTKNIERFEWFLEKATEMGIDEITPVICEHSERTVVKTERSIKVIISAMKQSVKAYLPKLNEMVKFNELVANVSKGERFIAHCGAGDKTNFKNALKKNEDVMILIGPEGDFSEKEIEFAIKNGFQPVSLGSSRLRTETAAIAVCHAVNFINE